MALAPWMYVRGAWEALEFGVRAKVAFRAAFGSGSKGLTWGQRLSEVWSHSVGYSKSAGKIAGAYGNEARLRGIVGTKKAMRWAATPSASRSAAIIGGAAGLGYITGDEAAPGGKWGHAALYGLGGMYGVRASKNTTAWSRANSAMKAGEWGTAGDAIREGLGLPAKWGMRHSIMAGAVYGALDPNVTIGEGAVFGGVAHVALRGGIKSVQAARAAGRGQNWYSLAIRGAALYGGYRNLGEGNGLGTNVLGGAALGAGIVGGGWPAAKFGWKHPYIGMTMVGPPTVFAMEALPALGQFAAAGAPGFNTLNADGDLALALHKMRHG